MKHLLILISIFIFSSFLTSCDKKDTASDPKVKINHPISEQALNEFVILQIAKQIGTPMEQIMPEKVFWDQPIHGDALDIIEVTMTIEERLDIMIDDQEVDRIAGSLRILSFLDNPQHLKIVDFQSLIREIYIRHYGTQKKK